MIFTAFANSRPLVAAAWIVAAAIVPQSTAASTPSLLAVHEATICQTRTGSASSTTSLSYTASAADRAKLLASVRRRDWASAKATFEQGSRFRGEPYTGVREPVDTLYRHGNALSSVHALYEASFCEGGSDPLAPSTAVDRSVGTTYKIALVNALYGDGGAARAELQAIIAAHPTSLRPQVALALVDATLYRESDARAVWWHLAVAGKPSPYRLEAIENLLYEHSMTGSVPTGSVTSARPAAPVVAPAALSSRLPLVFDVIGYWTDGSSPSTSDASAAQYVHVRVRLHPTTATTVRASGFRLTTDETQTYSAVAGPAPFVDKTVINPATIGYNGGLQSRLIGPVNVTEDLGALGKLVLQAGDQRTVVVTFAVPRNVAIDSKAINAVRYWAAGT